ncbi:hypothetical protein ISS03_05640 [Patescibacteria group bacterium]|nr:hypothetical protein [Patescibacteria group bacterium]
MENTNIKVIINGKGIYKDELEEIYKEKQKHFTTLAINTSEFLKKHLDTKDISFSDINFRVKSFESFWGKIIRKQYYNEPFDGIDDICGLRIIYYYPSDCPRIIKLIKDELEIVEIINKNQELEFNQFGYRSNHFVIKPPNKINQDPLLFGLDNLKAEIQIRTILMHAWAEIEHKLAYKSKDQIPDRLRRKFSQLSALFEIADERFEEIRAERIEFISKLKEHTLSTGCFNKNLDLNLDTFQAFLDYYLPNQEKNIKKSRAFLNEILPMGLSIKKLVENYEQAGYIAQDLKNDLNIKEKWSQIETIRTTLDLTDDVYWNSRKFNILSLGYVPFCEKYRKIIQGKIKQLS